MSLHGIISAMLTPFDEQGKLSLKRAEELVDYLIGSGVHGLFILGTNGEFVTLTKEEKIDLTKTVIKTTRKRVPVIAGVGAITTEEVIDLSKIMEELGADYLSVITPYFIQLSQEELYLHFKKIAEATDLKILLYNMPSKTGNHLEPNTVKRLSEIDNIVGIKDSSGQFETIESYIQQCREDFIVLSGTDSLILPTLKAGGSGGIAATSNVIPEIVVSIYESFASGDLDKAQKYQEILAPIREASQKASIPAVYKKSLEIKGIPVGKPRSPVKGLTEEQVSDLKKTLLLYDIERKLS